MKIALLPAFIKATGGLFICPIVGLCMWLMIYFIYRKKRLTQDLLSFYLKKFQGFYITINVLSFMPINCRPIYYSISIIFAIGIIVSYICNLIFLRRSPKLILGLQFFLSVQSCLLFYFLFALENMQLIEKILPFSVISLYFSTLLFVLNNARMFLVAERKAEEFI